MSVQVTNAGREKLASGRRGVEADDARAGEVSPVHISDEPDNEAIPFADLLKDFAAYMRNQRGLSAVMIRNRCWHVETFLDWFTELNRSFAEVSIRDVDAFLSLKAGQGWSRVSLATSAEALRSFFRHAEVRSWCAVGFQTWPDIYEPTANTTRPWASLSMRGRTELKTFSRVKSK